MVILTQNYGKFWFTDHFCDLIQECINTTETQILLNEAPCKSFKPTREIRQGEPLSPYLFLLSMEVFTRSLDKAEAEKKIQWIKIAKNAPPVSHMLFADDCLLFVKADLHNVNNLLPVISHFSSISGQQVNLQKSVDFFSKHLHSRHCRILLRRLKMKKMTLDQCFNNRTGRRTSNIFGPRFTGLTSGSTTGSVGHQIHNNF